MLYSLFPSYMLSPMRLCHILSSLSSSLLLCYSPTVPQSAGSAPGVLRAGRGDAAAVELLHHGRDGGSSGSLGGLNGKLRVLKDPHRPSWVIASLWISLLDLVSDCTSSEDSHKTSRIFIVFQVVLAGHHLSDWFILYPYFKPIQNLKGSYAHSDVNL